MADDKTRKDDDPAAEPRAGTDFDRAEDELVDLFLREEDDRPGKIAFLIVSVLFILLFLSVFPKSKKPQFEEQVIFVPEIEEYIPPVKEPPKVQKIEKQKVKKIALPDPTPDEPEPIVEPTPEPEPEPLPPNVKVRRGLPRGPPRKASGGPVREGTAGLTNPVRRKQVQPEYPEAAERIGFGGTVVVRAIIGTDGRIKQAEILKGLGKFGMDEAALAAVRQWEYEPGRLEGRPVEVIATIRVDYTLR